MMTLGHYCGRVSKVLCDAAPVWPICILIGRVVPMGLEWGILQFMAGALNP